MHPILGLLSNRWIQTHTHCSDAALLRSSMFPEAYAYASEIIAMGLNYREGIADLFDDSTVAASVEVDSHLTNALHKHGLC